MSAMQSTTPPAPWSRRQWLRAASHALATGGLLPLVFTTNALALPARTLRFPRDHGSHPELRTEWWYITGHVQADGRLFGFQVTFFRSRVDSTQAMRSALAAKHLVFAHAALTDVQGQRQFHDQRIARAGFGIAEASVDDTHVRLRDWSLQRSDVRATPTQQPLSQYRTQVAAQDFSLDLKITATQPVLLQGAQGLSRKGPEVDQASYYYSQPQLAVSGSISIQGKPLQVSDAPSTPQQNRAWMDHEWSEALMHPEAVGWDWIAMNLYDGSALTAFRLRRADGSTLWVGGSLRKAGAQQTLVFSAGSVQFQPMHSWQSPHSKASYPVQWRVTTPIGEYQVQALLNDQELDSSGSTGAIYWEGLCDLHDSDGQAVGRGYLEMTGYAQRIRLSGE